MQQTQKKYDVIFHDLADNTPELMARSHSKQFFNDIKNILAPDGFFCMGEEWSIIGYRLLNVSQTLKSAGLIPYSFTTRSDERIMLACKKPINFGLPKFDRQIDVGEGPKETVRTMFERGRVLDSSRNTGDVNTIYRPKHARYIKSKWETHAPK